MAAIHFIAPVPARGAWHKIVNLRGKTCLRADTHRQMPRLHWKGRHCQKERPLYLTNTPAADKRNGEDDAQVASECDHAGCRLGRRRGRP